MSNSSITALLILAASLGSEALILSVKIEVFLSSEILIIFKNLLTAKISKVSNFSLGLLFVDVKIWIKVLFFSLSRVLKFLFKTNLAKVRLLMISG